MLFITGPEASGCLANDSLLKINYTRVKLTFIQRQYGFSTTQPIGRTALTFVQINYDRPVRSGCKAQFLGSKFCVGRWSYGDKEQKSINL